MTDVAATQAWLECPEGERVPITGSISIGRVGENQVPLRDERVSRRHALIHVQGDGEFWLVDLGSRNGTQVNDRRVSQPVRLVEGDCIRIGPFQLTFRQRGTMGSAGVTHNTVATLMDIKVAPCWLLVADVEGSTRAAQAKSPDDLAVVMGQWFSQCKYLVETAGGTMNKYLGDGFLAFWKATSAKPDALATMLKGLGILQRAGKPDFRLALHHGEVALGGSASMGEESLTGPAVNFVFRMEKLAGVLGERCLLSAEATKL